MSQGQSLKQDLILVFWKTKNASFSGNIESFLGPVVWFSQIKLHNLSNENEIALIFIKDPERC